MTVFTDTAAGRVFLVTLEPYDPATGATVTLYAGTHGVVTEPTDTPADTFFEPIVKEALTFERSMFRPGHVGGRSLPDRGNLELVNTGAFEKWLDYHWEGRAVTVRMGRKGDSFSGFAVVFSGICGALAYERNTIVVGIRDKQEELDTLLQETLYAGSGGNEGGDDLKDKPKPVCLGRCLNVTPVTVDTTNHVFQVHDGQIEAIEAVYENGRSLTVATDYTVDLANGRFTLVNAPSGLVTADVKGDKTGGVYVSSAADIPRRVAVTYGGLADPVDLDTASFTALDAKTTAILGLYAGATARNVLDVLDDIAGSVGGVYGFDRDGRFTVGRLEAPSGAAALVIGENDVVENGVRRESFGPPVWRLRLDYGRCWTVQSADVLDATATDAHKEFVSVEYRTAAEEDTDVKEDGAGKGGHKGAVDPEPRPTLLVDKAAAEAEAARLLALFKEPREIFGVAIKAPGFETELGALVNFTHSRFRLSAGKDFVVVGIRENARAGDVELDLWG